MSEYIANNNLTVTATPNPPGSPWIPGTQNPTATFPASKADAPDGVDILVDMIKIDHLLTLVPPASINPCTLAGFDIMSGSGLIMASNTKTKCDNLSVLKENDAGNCQGLFVNSGTGATSACACDLKITNAGQAKAKTE